MSTHKKVKIKKNTRNEFKTLFHIGFTCIPKAKDFTSEAWSQMYIDPSEHFPYFPSPPRFKSKIKLFSQWGGDEVGKIQT